MMMPAKQQSSLMEQPRFQLTMGEEDYLKANGIRTDQLFILKQIKVEGINYAFGERAIQGRTQKEEEKESQMLDK